MKTKHSSKTLKRSRLLAAVVVAGLLLPATAVYASPDRSERNVATRAEGRRDHRVASRPVVQVDQVYRGALDGAIGTHTWTGDVFGTGVVTTVTYDIGLDADGVPMVTSVAVDESSLPDGATYEIRSGSVTTRQGETKPEETKAEDTKLEEPAAEDSTTDDTATDDPETLVSASVTATADDSTTDDSTTDDTAVDDETDDQVVDESDTDEAVEEGPDEAVTRFAGRAGVRFSMGGRWAGLLILVHGALGDEPVASVRTILVSPSMDVEQPDEGPTDETAVSETDDKPARPDVSEVRSQDERPDKADDERTKDRGDRSDRDRGSRSDRGDRSDGNRAGDRPGAGHDH